MALINLLPESYSKSPQVVEIQGGFDNSIQSFNAVKESLFNQLFVEDATWGLTEWEKALNIKTDITKSYEFRRERIKAKLRGAGTTTKSMIRQVATAYSNGEVEVIENPGNYSFTVKFVGTKGIPANMADLTLTIEEIKPAHLTFLFEYVWLTWDEFDGYNKTFDKWDELNLTWDKFESYSERGD